MQQNLATIRKVAGWTAEQFGEEIGVTRQTISNLERKKTPLSKTQYLAMRAVLNQEIIESDNEGLAAVLRALVDDPVEDRMEDDCGDDSISESPVIQAQSDATKMLTDNKVVAAMAKALEAGALLNGNRANIVAAFYVLISMACRNSRE